MYSVLGMNETGAALRLLFELKQRKNDKMSICSMLDKLLTSLSPLSPFSVSCSVVPLSLALSFHQVLRQNLERKDLRRSMLDS